MLVENNKLHEFIPHFLRLILIGNRIKCKGHLSMALLHIYRVLHRSGTYFIVER